MTLLDDLRVVLVQEPSSLDPSENRERVAELVAGPAAAESDLVVFPEAFARDFGEASSDLSAYAEATDGPFAQAVHVAATAAETTVLAGMFETSEDPARPYNTLIMRGATAADYRKIHLYDSFGYRESDRLSPGPLEPAVVEVNGWKVGLLTCYDLRFPEHARAQVDAGAEVLVVPAAWVAGPRKVEHWRTLVRARAIENTAYVVAVGQPGPRYTGHSLVVNPLGDVVAEVADGPALLSATLHREGLATARRTNPSLANRRLPPRPPTS